MNGFENENQNNEQNQEQNPNGFESYNDQPNQTESAAYGNVDAPTWVAPEPVVELTFMQRLTGILLSPGEVFQDLIRTPRLLFPMLLLAFSNVIFLLARFPLYKQYLVDTMKLTMRSSPVQLSAEQMQAAAGTNAIFGLIFAPIASVLIFLLTTAITMWILKIFKAEGTYKQYLSINGYTNIIGVLYLLITLVLSFFTANLYLDVPLDSIATFMSTTSRGTWAFGIAKGIRIFAIWQYAIFAMGAAQLSKIDKRIVYGVVFLGYLLMVIYGGYGEHALGKLLQ